MIHRLHQSDERLSTEILCFIFHSSLGALSQRRAARVVDARSRTWQAAGGGGEGRDRNLLLSAVPGVVCGEKKIKKVRCDGVVNALAGVVTWNQIRANHFRFLP